MFSSSGPSRLAFEDSYLCVPFFSSVAQTPPTIEKHSQQKYALKGTKPGKQSSRLTPDNWTQHCWMADLVGMSYRESFAQNYWGWEHRWGRVRHVQGKASHAWLPCTQADKEVYLKDNGVKGCSSTVRTRPMTKVTSSHFLTLSDEAWRLRTSPVSSWLKHPPFLRIGKVKCNIKFTFQPWTQSRPFPQALCIMGEFSLSVTPRTHFLLWVNLK